MTDHKFTDDEIIHSLKVCSNDGDCSECKINPHKGNYGYCTSLAIKAALDLINRQKAEIERLYIVLEENQKATKHWKDIAHRETGYVKAAKAEAIKEFAERLKSSKIKPEFPWDDFFVTEDTIDTLVKEMTEEQK